MNNDDCPKALDRNWFEMEPDHSKITLDRIWKTYGDPIFEGIPISPNQYAETKQAFLCGFAEAFNLFQTIITHLPEAKGWEFTMFLNGQIHDYLNDMLKQKMKQI